MGEDDDNIIYRNSMLSNLLSEFISNICSLCWIIYGCVTLSIVIYKEIDWELIDIHIYQNIFWLNQPWVALIYIIQNLII